MPIHSHSRREFIAMAGAAALAPAAFAAEPGSAPLDLVIKGGRLIDPARGIDALLDVAIAGGRVTSVGPDIASGAAQVLDAAGMLVVPGLIDIHTHATVDTQSPALMLADGVTGWVETGWQGADNIEDGIAAARAAPQTAGLLVNMGRKGVTMTGGETKDLALADMDAAREAIAGNRDYVLGIKARLSRMITGEHDREVLRRAQEVAAPLGVPVMIHIGDTFTPLGTLLDMLRPGDIVTHVYAPPPNAIVDEGGRIIPEAIAARGRGVLFDWGNGTRAHVLWDVVEQAFEQGFLPDALSTDWTMAGHESGIVDMPTIMSAVLSLGAPLAQVVAMATSNAARAFPLFEGRGTLPPGAPADVAVLEMQEGEFEFFDNDGNGRRGTQKLFPSATVLAGKLV